VPSGALFTDTVWTPFDVTGGSLEIIHIAGLTAVLSSMQTEITLNSLSISFTSGLQSALAGLSDAVAAIPTSQIRVAVGYQDQARFSISNATVDLNLALGLWEWRVLPLFSQIQRDDARLRHARMGHLLSSPARTTYATSP